MKCGCISIKRFAKAGGRPDSAVCGPLASSLGVGWLQLGPCMCGFQLHEAVRERVQEPRPSWPCPREEISRLLLSLWHRPSDMDDVTAGEAGTVSLRSPQVYFFRRGDSFLREAVSATLRGMLPRSTKASKFRISSRNPLLTAMRKQRWAEQFSVGKTP